MRSHLMLTLIALFAATPALARDMPEHALSLGCPANYAPVCAKKNGDAMGYRNECLARSDGAASVKLGHCSPGD